MTVGYLLNDFPVVEFAWLDDWFQIQLYEGRLEIRWRHRNAANWATWAPCRKQDLRKFEGALARLVPIEEANVNPNTRGEVTP